ncbi:hypothetical protein CAC42_6116 [Sphaceloma murrayae]|uniref:Uncharacterized protein n=1 Tax=Sphaceloma murrayae TaxID=2082308 RepID=A0A2K1QVD6_9PEZI|nr:hypothetical protein CAC42_6116 [Sphaceloma murrayae]
MNNPNESSASAVPEPQSNAEDPVADEGMTNVLTGTASEASNDHHNDNTAMTTSEEEPKQADTRTTLELSVEDTSMLTTLGEAILASQIFLLLSDLMLPSLTAAVTRAQEECDDALMWDEEGQGIAFWERASRDYDRIQSVVRRLWNCNRLAREAVDCGMRAHALVKERGVEAARDALLELRGVTTRFRGQTESIPEV